ncbi:hypothetical protein [Aporhodopirellula aestuarii]|uniref:Uncharacterized protein n=1 Tax=Aporhodopirellula aestuarii TaxID=2950107 RepID=A0ABT0U5N5_9BACT|nr:hypothetical protein [Aporhodopirellula aestuarii]MCM2372238.1 hypothetical protein [Aporhodopirellula aestuarii]
MIYFICWVVFLVGVILSVIIAHVMGNRGKKPSDPQLAEGGGFNEAMPMDEDGDVIEEPQAFEEVVEFDAAGGEPADDFAAFEQEFK